jgi:hypothetical protein
MTGPPYVMVTEALVAHLPDLQSVVLRPRLPLARGICPCARHVSLPCLFVPLSAQLPLRLFLLKRHAQRCRSRP